MVPIEIIASFLWCSNHLTESFYRSKTTVSQLKTSQDKSSITCDIKVPYYVTISNDNLNYSMTLSHLKRVNFVENFYEIFESQFLDFIKVNGLGG